MMTKRRVLRAVSLLAAVFVLSGCVNQKEEERNLAKALEEEYGEEFVVVDSIVTSANWLNAGPLEAVCYPKANRNLTFQAAYSDGQIYYDEYVQAVVREEAYAEMEEILSQYYKDFFLAADVLSPNIGYSERENYPRFTNISDVSIASYEEKYGDKMILSFEIIFNVNEIESYEEVCKICEQYSRKFTNGCVNYFCYYMDSAAINECKKIKQDDYWDHFRVNSKMKIWGNNVEYIYRFKESRFYLSQLSDGRIFQRFNNDGLPITESEE